MIGGVMSELVEWIRGLADKVTPALLEATAHKLPIIRAEFAQRLTSSFPRLYDQLIFLADVSWI